MAYASASDVSSLCRSLLGEFVTFNDSSCPTINQINRWLTSGCSIIESRLAQRGYSIPVGSGAGAYGWLNDLNTLFAAARAEMSRSNVTLGPGERTRGTIFNELFWQGLDELSSTDLTSMGVSRASRGAMYAGGISISDKQTYETDTDRTEPRFNRDMFGFEGTLDPTPTTAS